MPGGCASGCPGGMGTGAPWVYDSQPALSSAVQNLRPEWSILQKGPPHSVSGVDIN